MSSTCQKTNFSLFESYVKRRNGTSVNLKNDHILYDCHNTATSCPATVDKTMVR